MSKGLKALIVDDEALACDMLAYTIEKNVPAITQIKKVTSATEAIECIQGFEPDILFLDIQMPFMNGFELLTRVAQYNFSIIFTTAYNKYAIKAIRFSALDYLLKPVDADELKQATDRHIQRTTEKQFLKELYENFKSNLQNKEEKQYKLALRTNNGIRLVLPSEIMHCYAQNNYTKFFLTDGSTITVTKTIKEYEEILTGYQFIRSHKSHLVNINCIKEITADSFLVLTNGTKLEMSRRRKEDVMELLKTGRRPNK
jgi:two-component system, LytTR family, response regulator